ADLRNHGVVAIAAALIVSAGVHVYVGDDLHVQLAAHFPNLTKPSPIELDNAVSKAIRVNVVVVEKLLDRTHASTVHANQEGTALMLTACAPTKLIDALMPE